MQVGLIQSVKGLNKTKWSAFRRRRECSNRRLWTSSAIWAPWAPTCWPLVGNCIIGSPGSPVWQPTLCFFIFGQFWEYNMHLASHTAAGVEVRCMQAPGPLPTKEEERKVSLAASCVFLVWVTMPWQAGSNVQTCLSQLHRANISTTNIASTGCPHVAP